MSHFYITKAKDALMLHLKGNDDPRGNGLSIGDATIVYPNGPNRAVVCLDTAFPAEDNGIGQARFLYDVAARTVTEEPPGTHT